MRVHTKTGGCRHPSKRRKIMSKQCKFKVGKYNCGSYAFNLWKEDIEQGDRCDHHYWQERAMEAAANEREACAKVCEDLHPGLATKVAAEHIRARGQA
jgi:hypothetical protein